MVRIRSPRSLARMILMWIEAHCIRNANRSTIRPRERSRRLTTRTRTLRRTPAATAWPMACSDCGLTSTGVVSPKIPRSPLRAGFLISLVTSREVPQRAARGVAQSQGIGGHQRPPFSGEAGRPIPWRLGIPLGALVSARDTRFHRLPPRSLQSRPQVFAIRLLHGMPGNADGR